uniref:PID domain-containing protein n=1 Tax=Caenorhabditis japonica TaxID=281687 RepID=A0A8R1HS08_CAEJA
MPLPLCRCRVLYIGSAVPTITKDGLQGIQQPLKERYPIQESPDTRGIDSWLSVWSNGVLLEYIEGEKKSETAFFPIITLHYCAAVRYVNVEGFKVGGGGEQFMPLDSPFANIPNSPHPPIFAAIFRRTSGVKVLECHGFICTNVKAANALVRCMVHAYTETMHLKMDDRIPGLKAIKEGSTGEQSPNSPDSEIEENSFEDDVAHDDKTMKTWQERRQQDGEYDSVSISSSLVNKNKKAASETGGIRSALVPFEEPLRRAGSDNDLSYRGSMPPPPHHFGPPPMPPHFPMMPPFGFYPPPPRGMFPHPPPPHFMPRGAPFMPPPPPMFGRAPPRGYPMHPPPHPMMFRGYPPFFPPPPPHFGMPHRPSSPPTDGGPIITGPESVYGTMRRGAYEEPAYVGATGGFPEASYQPANFPTDQYESYYDTFKKRGTLKKADGGSVASTRADSAWDQYEAGIYRKPHINEKAFSGTLRSMAAKETSNATLNRSGAHAEVASQTVEAEITRPDSPPVDYEAFEKLKLKEAQKRAAQTAN